MRQRFSFYFIQFLKVTLFSLLVVQGKADPTDPGAFERAQECRGLFVVPPDQQPAYALLPDIQAASTEQLIEMCIFGSSRESLMPVAALTGLPISQVAILREALLYEINSDREPQFSNLDSPQLLKLKATVQAVQRGLERFWREFPHYDRQRYERLLRSRVLTNHPESLTELSQQLDVRRQTLGNQASILERKLMSFSRQELKFMRWQSAR